MARQSRLRSLVRRKLLPRGKLADLRDMNRQLRRSHRRTLNLLIGGTPVQLLVASVVAAPLSN
jgi:hypothetical protein